MRVLSSSTYNEHDRAILARHVTNTDGNVYAILNLPEEVIAVIFAYVSRSPLSFRANLLKLVKEGDVQSDTNQPGLMLHGTAAARAAAFHERWVIGYGHSSVAEHAVSHVGVESISRLASAELELANSFISFTEYSQRYQKPERGDYYIPSDLAPALRSRYDHVMNALYDAYEALYLGLVPYLEQKLPRQADETASAWQSRIAKVAFEDARYALPLATLTNLGLTGNGRALRDAITCLQASHLPESVTLAKSLAEEVGKVIPTLLRHAVPSAYQLKWQDALADLPSTGYIKGPKEPEAHLLRYTGQGAANPEAAALQILAGVIDAAAQPTCDPEQFLTAIMSGIGPYDVLPDACRWIRYDCELLLSEAAWHQLLRHIRGMQFQWGPPEVSNGYTIPPNVQEAGLTATLQQAIGISEELYGELRQSAPACAGYAVTNAHRRRIRSELDLRQLYHLVNLRVSEHAQWDIRAAVTQMWEQVKAVHPRLAAHASRRV